MELNVCLDNSFLGMDEWMDMKEAHEEIFLLALIIITIIIVCLYNRVS